MKPSYIIASVALALAATACDDNLEAFEPTEGGYTGTPTTIESVTAESLPGQIKLTWNDGGNYEYMRMWYQDPMQGNETITKLFTPSISGVTEVVIDNTRARYGDYTFYFQCFNANNEGGAVKEIKAQSGPAAKTFTETGRTKVTITAAQLSTDNQEPSEGPISNLVDGNTGSMFHTRWSSPQAENPGYIQVDFAEPHGAFAVKYCTRDIGNKDGFPTSVTLQTSTDGENWTDVGYLSEGLPTTRVTWYESTWFNPSSTYTHFRFVVTSASTGSHYFHMSEFEFYDVDLAVYDPETDEDF